MKVKIKFFAKIDQFHKEVVDISVAMHDMSKYWGPKFKELEIDVEPPTYQDLVQGTVEFLREQQADIRAKCELDVNEIEQKIQSLLCIENNPSEIVE